MHRDSHDNRGSRTWSQRGPWKRARKHPKMWSKLAGRYGLEMKLESIPELVGRFGLR